MDAELDAFIGRHDELGQLRRLVSHNRLVTLIGPGGIGKTRLANRALRLLRRDHAVVWFVELADLQQAGVMEQVVAESLGVRPTADDDWPTTVFAFLADRDALLVLDNCEHLLADAAALVSRWLSACPTLRVMTTSQAPLGVTGEVLFSLPAMAAPSCEERANATAAEMKSYEAVQLFVSRAQAAYPAFRLNDDNASAVAKLCHVVDGIPLAIELAAARMKLLSADQLLARLDDPLRILARGPRQAPQRHRSLRDSLQWSYEHCETEERLLWARLSAFAGGFQLPDVEAVCSDGAISADQIVDLVDSLLEKSVLRRDDSGGAPVFRMPAAVGQFGREQLELLGTEVQSTRRRHMEWFSAEAARFAASWIGPDQPALLAWARRHYPNLRKAIETALRVDAADVAMRIATAIAPFWHCEGRLTEGRYWLDEALDTSAGTTLERLRALRLCAWLGMHAADLPYAKRRLAEAETQLRADFPQDLKIGVATARAGWLAFSGDLEGARQEARRAVDLPYEHPDLDAHLQAMRFLALFEAFTGDHQAASETAEALINLAEPTGETYHSSFAAWAAATSALIAGDPRRAESLLAPSLQMRHALRDKIGTALALEGMSMAALRQGQLTRAAILLGAYYAAWDSSGLAHISAPRAPVFRLEVEQLLKAQLDESVYREEWARGRRMSLDRAVAFALGEHAAEPEAPSTSTVTLTRREREIAALLARGLSNQQIADELVIATRTAEGHVANIIHKLGFRTRSQVAAWYVGQTREHHILEGTNGSR